MKFQGSWKLSRFVFVVATTPHCKTDPAPQTQTRCFGSEQVTQTSLAERKNVSCRADRKALADMAPALRLCVAFVCCALQHSLSPSNPPAPPRPARGLAGASVPSPGHESLAGRNAGAPHHAAGRAVVWAPTTPPPLPTSTTPPRSSDCQQGAPPRLSLPGSVTRVQGRAGNFPPLTHIPARSEPRGGCKQESAGAGGVAGGAAQHKTTRHWGWKSKTRPFNDFSQVWFKNVCWLLAAFEVLQQHAFLFLFFPSCFNPKWWP